MKERTVKEIVSDFLGFLKYKVDNDALTMEDVKALAHAIMNCLPISGSVKDFASYYGKSADSIRHVICYKMAAKPKRRVTYSFQEFDAARPRSWNNESQITDNQNNKP